MATGNGDLSDRPDAWVKCDGCGEILYRKELARSAWVCALCNHHFRVGAVEYIELLADPGSFEERHAALRSADPLNFSDFKKYTDRLKETYKKLSLSDAVVVGIGTSGGHSTGYAFMDFTFMGGSMGSVVGERIARMIGDAIERRTAVVIVSSSGGARMQEGILSLMQMAKTSAMLGKLREAKLPYVSILTHPTTGGVTASFSSLGDVILAEPNALVGFAGPRVIRETINQDLPSGFQRSEFLLAHGLIDRVVDRRELKRTLVRILDFFAAANSSAHARASDDASTNHHGSDHAPASRSDDTGTEGS